MPNLEHFFRRRGIRTFGVADLSRLPDPVVLEDRTWPKAVSFAVPMKPELIAEVQTGPTDAYAQEYRDLNQLITQTAEELVCALQQDGYPALQLAASERTDPVGLKGDFPHKTAATLSGIGWVGRSSLLLTSEYGPWVRLGTVFADCPVSAGAPQRQNHCGTCYACVEACPAQALTGGEWTPGISRSELLDAEACERFKKEYFYRYNEGNNCGICAAVCPLCSPSI
jgi:epoxyqueuosine reductase QueG